MIIARKLDRAEREFRTPQSKVRKISHRARQGAKISHTTIQGAKFNSRCEIPNLRCENFATVGHNFEALTGAQIMHMICHFKAWEVRNPALQTVCDLDLKQRSYDRLKTTMQS